MTSEAEARPEVRSDIRRVARGGVAGLAGAAVAAVANFAVVLVVTRTLTRQDAGVLFTATSLFVVAEVVLRLGADTALVFFIPRWRAAGRVAQVRAGLRTAAAPVAVACVLVAVAVLVFAGPLAVVAGASSTKLSAAALLRILAIALPVACLYDLALGATRGLGSMRATVLVDRVLRSVLQLGLVAAVLAVGADAAVGLAWVLPYFAAAALLAPWLRRMLPAGGPRDRHAGTAAAAGLAAVDRRLFWRFAIPRALAGVAQMLLQRLDIVLIAALRGPAEAAVYTAATRFLVVGQFVNQAISAPLQPRLSARIAVGDTAGAQAVYRFSTAWLVLANWPVFAAAAVLSPTYMRLFGHDYRGGVVAVVLLAAAMLFANLVGVVDAVIVMAGRSSWNLATTLAALVVNVAVDVALIPGHGIVGAAIGWAASIVTANVVPLLLCWRRLHIHPFDRRVLLSASLCAGCFAALPLVCELIMGKGQLGAVVGELAGAVVFVAAVARGRRYFGIDSLLRRRADVSPTV